MDGLIEIYTGTLGSGKTLSAVERIWDHLLRGGWVFTNVQMHVDQVRDRMLFLGYVYDPARLVILTGDMSQFHRQVMRGSDEQLVMVVIDEAHLSFNARDWTKLDRELMDFATLCRKLDINLLFLTQSELNLDKQFLRLTSYLWICRNFAHFRFAGVIPLPIPLLSRVCFDRSRGSGKPLKMMSELYLKKIWLCKMYNSKALLGKLAGTLGSMATATATPLQRCKRVMPSKSFPVGNVAALLAVVFVWFC